MADPERIPLNEVAPLTAIPLSEVQSIEEGSGNAKNGGILSTVQDLLTAAKTKAFGYANGTPEELSFLQRRARDLAEIPGDIIQTGKSALALIPETARQLHNTAGGGAAPLSDLPEAALRAYYKSLPEGKKAEGMAALAAGIAATMLPGGQIVKRGVGALLSPVLASELTTQIKGGGEAGTLADTGERLASAGTKAAGLLGAGALAGKVANPALQTLEGKLRVGTEALRRFKDPNRQRLLAFSDELRETKTRQGAKFYDELQKPEMKKLIEVDPGSPQGSRYPKILKNVQDEIPRVSKQLDDLVTKAAQEEGVSTLPTVSGDVSSKPGTVRIKLKDIDLSKVTDRIKGAPGEPEGTARAAIHVWDNELDNFAKRALNPEEIRQYRAAKRIRQNYEQGHGRPLDIDQGEDAFSAEMKRVAELERADKIIGLAEEKIMNQEFTLEEIKKFKSDFDSRGRYDRHSDPDAENQADVYRDMGAAFRNKLGEHLGLDEKGNIRSGLSPKKKAIAEEYQKTNKFYQTLVDFQRIVGDRVKELDLYGPYFKAGAFRDRERGLMGKITSSLYPHASVPESRLRFADTRPYRKEGHLPLTIGQAALSAPNAIARGGVLATEGAGRLAASPAGAAIAGALGIANANDLPPTPVPASISASPVGPTAANMPAPTPTPAPAPIALPRDSEAFFQAPLEAFQGLPEEALNLIKTAQTASPRVKRKALAEIMKMDNTGLSFAPPPHQWLKGYTVVDGRVEDPLEAVAFAEDVTEHEKAGEISGLQSAKIRNALNAGEPVTGFLLEAAPKGEIKPEKPAKPQEQSGEQGATRLSYGF